MANDSTTRTAAPEPEDDLLTLAETIAFLGVSKQTLYRMMERGEIKGIKVGRQWRFRKTDLQAYLERGPQAAVISTAPPDMLDEEIAFFATELQRVGITGPLGQVIDREPQETSEEMNPGERKIIKLVNQMISLAIETKASDIHIEPERGTIGLRIRVDGVLHEVRRMPSVILPALMLRLKAMAGMDIEERRIPQDGRLHIRHNQHDFDVRMNVIPSIFGESAVMRILDQSSVLIGLEKLGFSPEDLERLRGLLRHPNGLMLATGPTGSGKTTTLYSCLNALNRKECKVLTIEDPVEYQINGVVQVGVNRRAGLTFPVAMRAFLRQDPDIIMAGEIRDLEMANIAVQAALTGHLVLSTLHTEDAPSAALRFVEMGIEPFLVASSFLGVLSQRLVRKLCPHCKQPADLPAPMREHIELVASDGGYTVPKDTAFYAAVGCEECYQRGFRGRMGIYEVLEFTPAVKEAFLGGATRKELTTAAVQSGMRTLRADGIRKAVEGLTTIDEVLRVVPE